MNTYHKQVKSKSRYREFAKVLNGVLQLTEREMDLFSMFMYIDKFWPSNNKDKNLNSRISRNYIMKELNMMSSNLSHYIRGFKEKGILFKDEIKSRKYILNPMFRPIDEDSTFKIQFVLDFNKN